MAATQAYTLRRIALPYAAWWISWTVMQVFILHRFGIDWSLAIADSAIFSIVLAGACIISALIFRFYRPGSGGRIYRLIFALGVTLVDCSLFQCLMEWLYADRVEYLNLLSLSMPLRFAFALLMLAFQGVMSWLLGHIEEQRLQAKQNQETAELAKEAELARLRQQLQPHFLFNSLNSISALAGSNPSQARTMIQQLSDFLRATIRKDDNKAVSAREELDQLQLYLAIEKVRFGSRLNVDIRMEPSCETLRIPPLLLQPVVENAIKFGLYGTTETVTIHIQVTCQNNTLQVAVTNPYDPNGGGGGTGFGLSGLSRRLFLLYGRADLLEAVAGEKEFTTRIRIPQ